MSYNSKKQTLKGNMKLVTRVVDRLILCIQKNENRIE